MAIIARDD